MTESDVYALRRRLLRCAIAAHLCHLSLGASYDVFLLAGQSNMDAAPILGSADLPQHDHVDEFTWQNALQRADQVTRPRIPPHNRRTRTPAVEFGNAYAAAHPDRHVLLVPCGEVMPMRKRAPVEYRVHFIPALSYNAAVQSTSFFWGSTQWADVVPHWNTYVGSYGGALTSRTIESPTEGVWLAHGLFFNSTVRRAQEAMLALNRSGTVGSFAGVLWIHGETDASNGFGTDAYRAALEAFITALRGALDTPDLPFIIGGWGSAQLYNHAGFAKIDAARRVVAASMPYVAYVDSSDFDAADTAYDGMHFSVSGMSRIGLRMFATIEALEYTTAGAPSSVSLTATPPSTLPLPLTASRTAIPTRTSPEATFSVEAASRTPSQTVATLIRSAAVSAAAIAGPTTAAVSLSYSPRARTREPTGMQHPHASGDSAAAKATFEAAGSSLDAPALSRDADMYAVAIATISISVVCSIVVSAAVAGVIVAVYRNRIDRGDGGRTAATPDGALAVRESVRVGTAHDNGISATQSATAAAGGHSSASVPTATAGRGKKAHASNVLVSARCGATGSDSGDSGNDSSDELDTAPLASR